MPILPHRDLPQSKGWKLTSDPIRTGWRAAEYDPYANSPKKLDDPDRDELRRVLLGFDGPWGGDWARLARGLLMGNELVFVD